MAQINSYLSFSSPNGIVVRSILIGGFRQLVNTVLQATKCRWNLQRVEATTSDDSHHFSIKMEVISLQHNSKGGHNQVSLKVCFLGPYKISEMCKEVNEI